jgi:hypothetical protein
MLPPSQAEFLADKFTAALVKQPQWAQLRARLLALAGEMVVAVYEEDLTELLERGCERAGAVRARAGVTSHCHANAAGLWEQDPGNIIVSGYALSADDGLWRQHSWCERGTHLIETTEPRSLYFGFALNEAEAADFAANNF